MTEYDDGSNPRIAAAMKVSGELSTELMSEGQEIAELYRSGKTLDELARIYVESYDRSVRVAINVIWRVLKVAIPDKEERKNLALRHILHAAPGDDIEVKKQEFAKMAASARRVVLVSDEERAFLDAAIQNSSNIGFLRHPNQPNFNKIALDMESELGIRRPASTLRRIVSYWKRGEIRTHQGDVMHKATI